jgi:lipoprotein NlpI
VREKLPNDKTVYYERGVVYQLMGNHRLAIRDFDKAIELYPKYADALFCLGVSRL